MSDSNLLKDRYETLVNKLTEQFSDGETLEVDQILFIVGLQELGQLHRKFSKDEKINVIHIAICRLLEPYGYYAFSHFDEDGWPHYNVIDQLPFLKAGEQSRLMKEALVQYFLERAYLD
ncbi:MAG: hypothetical protein ACO3RO_05355 [Flavobacteriaceae bacterium]